MNTGVARSLASLLARRGAPPAALRSRAEQAAAAFPPLLVAAERVAATVAQGVHGRRRVGQGETFWQFRQYEPGDAASRIDWRESAKSQRLYVRETEWEAAQSVWLWRDASASMDYSSAEYIAGADWPTKRDRAELLLVALASLLVRGGERLTMLGSGLAPMSGRIALTRVVEMLGRDGDERRSLPAFEPLPRAGLLVLIGDFLSPLDIVDTALGPICRERAQGPPAAGRRPGRGRSAVRRPGALCRGRGTRRGRGEPCRKHSRRVLPAGSATTAPGLRRSPAGSAGPSACTAPIVRRAWRCWRCTRALSGDRRR